MDSGDTGKYAAAKCRIMKAPEDVCGIEPPASFGLVVFGASGDLTRRKIIPAMYRLMADRHLPASFFILGAALDRMDDGSFRAAMETAVRDARPEEFSPAIWDEFSGRLYYQQGRFDTAGFYDSLGTRISELERMHETCGNRVFYLAIPPTVYETVIDGLGEAGLSNDDAGFVHISIEKPFGHDLESSHRLNAAIRKRFREVQVYRMDHYLAKENVQNILMFRFANSIFEPLWNYRYIDHVQITVSETLGVEHRAGYYEKSGVLRDMIQSHLLQLLALTAMEPPSEFMADRVRDEKVKVFRSIRPFPLDRLDEHIVVGQYGPGEIDGVPVPGYMDEPGVAPGSTTPTYAALKFNIDNWRWRGVPFYLRSGKRLAGRKAEIAIRFKRVPHLMLSNVLSDSVEPNTLVMRIQPDEGISLLFQTKQPDSKVCLRPVLMDFSYKSTAILDAYERVLLDCMGGDQMLFVREDGEERKWELMSPVIEKLESQPEGKPLLVYEAGSDGPAEAAALIERDGRNWREL